MSRKRKRKSGGSKYKKTARRLTKKQRSVVKCVIGSVWRAQTADTETTVTGKEVLSGWKRYKIVDREVNENADDGKITVQYLDDSDNDEPIEYDVHDFIVSADPAPVHINLVTDEVGLYVGRE